MLKGQELALGKSQGRLQNSYKTVLLSSLVLLFILTILSLRYGSIEVPTASVFYSFGLDLNTALGGLFRYCFYSLAPEFFDSFELIKDDNMKKTIVRDLRLPRSILACLVGAILAIVGAILQSSTKNDLADPFLFGLSSGASFGAVIIITRFGDAGLLSLGSAAFAGGLLSAVLVLSLFVLQRDRASTTRLIICGLAISFCFQSCTNFLLFLSDTNAASQALFWSLGGLGLARWNNLSLAIFALFALLVLLFFRSRALDVLLAGEQSANSLGVNVTRLRIEVFIVCALASSICVALTGVIGFIGLMVPHMARLFSGVTHRYLLPLCMLFGANLLLASDIVARKVLAPQELPLGIITGLLGGGFILCLLFKKR